VARRDTTVAAVVRDWQANLPADVRSPITGMNISAHAGRIIAAIGNVKITRLTVAQVEAMLRQMAADGYATSTISRTRSVLRRAIRRAMRDGVATRNVAELADLPRGQGAAVPLDDAGAGAAAPGRRPHAVVAGLHRHGGHDRPAAG